MNRKLFSIVTVLAIASTIILSAAAQVKPQINRGIMTNPGPIVVGTKVSLGCKNPGSHQDVAKTPTITNTTGKPLPAGKKVYWSATDGDKGNLSLQSQLPANGTVQAMGSAGNGYSCQAWILQ